jgi:hypothetical protein
MKEFLIQLGGVFDFDIATGAGRSLEQWVSQYPASVYQAAQKGTAEHPLCKVIADQLQACEITHKTMVINNAPTGAAVDIGAYLAGEPDCMLNFDAVTDRAAPINFNLSLNVANTVKADAAAKGVANCFAALQSLAITRPVTVTPFIQTFADSQKSTVKITLAPIILSDTLDFTKLALLSDPRTLRQFMCSAYMDGTAFKPTKGIPMDRSADDKSLTATNDDGAPTSYEQASERIKRLLEAQNV